MDWTNEYTEQDWRNDADARERADWQRDEIALGDFEEFRPQLCDGSGAIDEYYVDVDITNIVPCPGCPACDPAPAPAVVSVSESIRQTFWRKAS
jgi:hypothetical protein